MAGCLWEQTQIWPRGADRFAQPRSAPSEILY